VAKEKGSYAGAFLKPVLARRESGRGKKRSVETAE